MSQRAIRRTACSSKEKLEGKVMMLHWKVCDPICELDSMCDSEVLYLFCKNKNEICARLCVRLYVC